MCVSHQVACDTAGAYNHVTLLSTYTGMRINNYRVRVNYNLPVGQQKPISFYISRAFILKFTWSCWVLGLTFRCIWSRQYKQGGLIGWGEANLYWNEVGGKKWDRNLDVWE